MLLYQRGVYGNKTYTGSGQSVANIIKAALLNHLVQVDISMEQENYKTAIISAKQAQADYLFYSTILHWEDRATEWSSIPDRADIKIVIVSTSNTEIISSVIINGKSGLATFGGDHPQDLLPEPVGKFINSLFN